MNPDELEELEAMVLAALAARRTSTLNVLGFGEVSMALGWPIDEPRLVAKRLPLLTKQQFAHYESLVTGYVQRLRSGGLDVVRTEVAAIDVGNEVRPYLIQPMLPADALGHRVLAATEPDPDHPFLAAVADTLQLVHKDVSLDAQVTNFAWQEAAVTLIDVGTPFLWDTDGNFLFDMEPFGRMIPAPLRSFVIRDLTKLVSRWRQPRAVAIDVVSNLHREGLTDWVDPTIVALNRGLPPDDAIHAAEARAYYEEDLKTWPRLKRLQTVERWWQSTVRRRPYDFFIHSTFGTADAGRS